MSDLGITEAIRGSYNKQISSKLTPDALNAMNMALQAKIKELVNDWLTKIVDGLLVKIPTDSDPENLAKKEHLDDLKTDIQKLPNGINMIYDEADGFHAVLTSDIMLLVRKLQMGTRFYPSIPFWSRVEDIVKELVETKFSGGRA